MRLVKANHLNLQRFQFDYDLTFAVFFMNADWTVYGRYGTRRSVKNAGAEMTKRGLAESMKRVLQLHQQYPSQRKRLVGKQPLPVKYRRPDEYPSLRGKFKKDLNYKGNVSRSCMHCHQIRDAERQVFRNASRSIPDRSLLPNPSPRVLGIELDPRTRATVAKVAGNSIAARAGIKKGDDIVTLGGQAIVSQADVQWVLHHAGAETQLPVQVLRNNGSQRFTLTLTKGWRNATDISWRVTSWSLRRMVTGGILFAQATEKQRRSAGVAKGKMALVAKHVGQYGKHAVAKRAGFRKGDIIVSFDGLDQDMTTSQLLAYGARKTKPGQIIPVTVIRGKKRLRFRLRMQR